VALENPPTVFKGMEEVVFVLSNPILLVGAGWFKGQYHEMDILFVGRNISISTFCV
jgi:hypothetical protein